MLRFVTETCHKSLHRLFCFTKNSGPTKNWSYDSVQLVRYVRPCVSGWPENLSISIFRWCILKIISNRYEFSHFIDMKNFNFSLVHCSIFISLIAKYCQTSLRIVTYALLRTWLYLLRFMPNVLLKGYRQTVSTQTRGFLKDPSD